MLPLGSFGERTKQNKTKLLPQPYIERKKGKKYQVNLGIAPCWFLYTTRLYYTLKKKKLFLFIRPKNLTMP